MWWCKSCESTKIVVEHDVSPFCYMGYARCDNCGVIGVLNKIAQAYAPLVDWCVIRRRVHGTGEGEILRKNISRRAAEYYVQHNQLEGFNVWAMPTQLYSRPFFDLLEKEVNAREGR